MGHLFGNMRWIAMHARNVRLKAVRLKRAAITFGAGIYISPIKNKISRNYFKSSSYYDDPISSRPGLFPLKAFEINGFIGLSCQRVMPERKHLKWLHMAQPPAKPVHCHRKNRIHRGRRLPWEPLAKRQTRRHGTDLNIRLGLSA